MTALLVLGFVGPSRADLPFSNLNQGANGYVSFESNPNNGNPADSPNIRLASDFRTDDTAWTVTSVAALLRNTDIFANEVTFSIFTNNPSGPNGAVPGTLVGSFGTTSIPANASTGNFTATGSVTLQANTVYWLVAQVQESDLFGTVDWFYDSGQGTDAGSLFSTVPLTSTQLSDTNGALWNHTLNAGNFMFSFEGEAVANALDVELAGNTLSNGGNAVLPTTVTGQATTLTFTIRNMGTQDLTNLAITIDGANASDFVISQPPVYPVTRGNTTTFTVQFLPTSGASSVRSAAFHLTSNAGAPYNPFAINISGQALSFTSSTGGDGMSDAAKFLNSALGFDWTQNQQALVTAYYANAYAAGLYTTAQFQSMNVNTPLIQRDSATGLVTLTLTLETTSNLNQSFSTLPFNVTGSTMNIDGQGRLLFSFPTSVNTQLFRLQAQ